MKKYTLEAERHRKSIMDYIEKTSFKQVALGRLCDDLKIDKVVACRCLTMYVHEGKLEREKMGKTAIYSLKQ
jgi:hypothetical protein